MALSANLKTERGRFGIYQLVDKISTPNANLKTERGKSGISQLVDKISTLAHI